jgi:small-conductance mechanosensitive channel
MKSYVSFFSLSIILLFYARINYAQIDTLKHPIKEYPVFGINNDTLFEINAKMGAYTAEDRAASITKKIKRLYDDNFLKVDSITFIKSDNNIDIVYKDLIIMSISKTDALLNNKSQVDLAEQNTRIIKDAILKARKNKSFIKVIFRIVSVLLVLACVWLMLRLIGKAHIRLMRFILGRKEKWFRNMSYKDYTFLTSEQELRLVLFILKIMKWVFIVILLYLILPIIFSIFPFTRSWADNLFLLVWSPVKHIFITIWDYLPNIFTILVIYFVMRYFIRFVRYIFSEIKAEKLKISGFHPDWAMPTFGIVRFLLYAFMFVLIFPYLPGSDSSIFKGVSVFIGVLFSLGSSSAIANIIAGLVITYMRPFKIGDRIKIGEITGDVIEKTMLVTRLRTIKNEEITIPNSTVLTGNTINFSTYSKNEGLIIHTTLTISYDVPWKDMHQALIDAALRTSMILHDPKPFVLQTSLDDFYVSY